MPFVTRKDINFNNEEIFLFVKDVPKLVTTIKHDSEFFEDLFLMDYSLLVLKFELTNESQLKEYVEFQQSPEYLFYQRHIFYSSKYPNVAYIISIIDYLQHFSLFKKLENKIKTNITERPDQNNGISCVPPDVYSVRFYKYIFDLTDFN
jgi:hypothetical protein